MDIYDEFDQLDAMKGGEGNINGDEHEESLMEEYITAR